MAITFLAPALVLPASAEIKRHERKSLLDSEPGVIYREPILGKPLELQVM